MTYSEKLKDPRWQKKRLEILEAANWKCQGCGESSKTLHVHHLIYMRDYEPWDAPKGTLMALCEKCHEVRGELEHDAKLEFARICGLLSTEGMRRFTESIINTSLEMQESRREFPEERDGGAFLLSDISIESISDWEPFRWIYDNIGAEAAKKFAGRNNPQLTEV